MAYVCTVIFNADVSRIEEVERQRPELIQGIMEAASGRMTNHQRLSRPGMTLEIDEYDSEQAYREFMTEAAPYISAYAEAIGAAPVDVLWQRSED